MKIPSTFAWLSAAVIVATLALLGASRLMSTTEPALPALPTPSAPASAPGKSASGNRVQIAFLLDTSSSMDGLIDQAKARLWNILNEVLQAEKDGESPDIEVALYHYGNTALLPEKGYVQRVVPLTTDVDLLSEKLFALTTSGGDEYCGRVIHAATNELAWDASDNTLKLIYIAGNEDFYQGDLDPKDALAAARQRGISVNTIFCGSPRDQVAAGWQNSLTDGDGDYFYIDQNETVAYIESPHDDRIEVINRLLNQTYIPVGNRGAQLKANQIAQDANAASYGKANLSSRAKYKASKKYKAANWDLVDAFEDDQEQVLRVKTTLPDSLAQLPKEQLVQKVAAIKQQRERLRDELNAATSQRDAYVAQARQQQATAQANTLGEKLVGSIRKELTNKNYKVKEQ